LDAKGAGDPPVRGVGLFRPPHEHAWRAFSGLACAPPARAAGWPGRVAPDSALCGQWCFDDLFRASIARSIQSIRGFGFLRRSTATSWRKTSISTFFDADDLASSASQDSTRTVKR
jgi:hypothetical protein